MERLNLPAFDHRIKSKENKLWIFDPTRKKDLLLTPEEWVRQNFIQYLVHNKKYPLSLIATERELRVGQTKKRTDIVVFDRLGHPRIIVECKSSKTALSQESFDQIARYNWALEAEYLVLTNGLTHYYCQTDRAEKRYHFLRDLPSRTEINWP